MVANNRLLYFDNLRALCVIQVVFCHSIMGYMFPPSFIVPASDIIGSDFWEYFLVLTKIYCVEIFFFISGYFLCGEVSRKSIQQIIIGKFYRLAVPSIISQIILLLFFFNTMPVTWYMEVLFLFTLLMMPIQYVYQSFTFKLNMTLINLVLVALFVGVLTFCVKLRYPLYYAKCYLFLHFEPSEMIKNFVMFYLGALAYRNNWLEKISDNLAKCICGVGVILCVIGFVKQEWIFDIMYKNNFGYTLLDCLQCFFVGFSFILLSKKFMNRTNKFLSFLCDQSVGVYLLHDIFLFPIQLYLVNRLDIYIPYKIVIVVVLTMITSFSASFFLRKIPGVKKLF